MCVDQIFNFIGVNDRIATSGQPTEEQFSIAHAEGYRAVINLAPYGKSHPRFPKIGDEASTLSKLGMRYRYIPVDWQNPRVEDYDAFCVALEEFKDDKLLIHCAANLRVSVFFALWAMKKLNWGKAQSDQFIGRAWKIFPGNQMDDTWKKFIEAVTLRTT